MLLVVPAVQRLYCQDRRLADSIQLLSRIAAAWPAGDSQALCCRGIECEKWALSDSFESGFRNASGTYNVTFYFPVNQWQIGRQDYHRLLKETRVSGQLDDGDTFELYQASPWCTILLIDLLCSSSAVDAARNKVRPSVERGVSSTCA